MEDVEPPGNTACRVARGFMTGLSQCSVSTLDTAGLSPVPIDR